MTRVDAYGREYEPEDVLDGQEYGQHLEHVDPNIRARAKVAAEIAVSQVKK